MGTVAQLSPTRLMGAFAALGACALLLVAPNLGNAQDNPEPPPEVVVVARSDNPADALGAGPVAGILGAPVLVTPGSRLMPVTAERIEAIDPELVVLAGGEAALSAQVEDDVSSLGYATRRVAGRDRHETAALLAGLLAEYQTGRPLLSEAPITDEVVPVNAERLDGLSLAELLAQIDADFLGADESAVDSQALQGRGPEDFIPAGHDSHVQQTMISSAALSLDYEPRGAIEMELGDPCGDGLTAWNVRASMSGSFLTGSNPDTGSTLALTIDNASNADGDELFNQTLQATGQLRQNYALDRVFTGVAPGTHTVRVLARTNDTSPFVQLLGQLIASTSGYRCE